ncbi:MAG TPA: diguanylate cyclase [Rhodanobacter sp.]|nr:diguanylate cyclase [Rhodanobacter sp.]
MGDQEQRQGGLRERFYQSVAETLTLLHTAPGYDRKQAMLEVARTLASTMDLPLVWIGRLELGHSRLAITAAGPAMDYASSLRISDDPHDEGGRGPAGIVLREGRARLTLVDSPEYAPWLESARAHGLGSIIVAASGTNDGGQLVLAVYSRDGDQVLTEELLDWAQRLADELARFWDDQALLDRNLRLSRYRDAHRTIQRAMLDQPDPASIYLTLATTLVEIDDSATVAVYVPEGNSLCPVVRLGQIADAMGDLAEQPMHVDGTSSPTVTMTYMTGVPTVRMRPSIHPDVPPAWRTGPLAQMGAIGCWPIFSMLAGDESAARKPAAMFLLATTEIEAFDADMHQLLDEIADTAGLGLRQYSHQQALSQEQDRQTYLALHDALTDLPNRRALDYHLERALARAERHQRLVAVGMLDLDDLKPINDRYGHAAGDRVLIEVAGRLHHALRSEDSVARIGGDEFVLVFEDLGSADDLNVLLERLWQSLQQPIAIGDSTIQITVSLGVSLYPSHAQASGEQLLRLADQAMYQVKVRKRQRSSWWALARPGVTEQAAEDNSTPAMPHGDHAAALLQPCVDAWRLLLPAVVERFCNTLKSHHGISGMLGSFPSYALDAFTARLSRQLHTLIYPNLLLEDQRVGAIKAGICQAACGLEEVWLLEAIEQCQEILVGALGLGARANRTALAIVLQRLAMEGQWQLEAMHDLQRRRGVILASIQTLAWSAGDYLQLLEGVVRILATHEEILVCAAGRPDASGEMIHELVAGTVAVEHLRVSNAGLVPAIRIDRENPQHDEPIRQAWTTAQIQRCVHYGSDPAMALWRDTAIRHGIVSHVAIPLCLSKSKPLAILTLYSPYAGGFQSESQQAFVEQIKAMLELALLHMAPRRLLAALLPAFVRERWRTIIAGGALRMHYQPMIRLADRQVVGFEALARLRDDMGSLQLPASFLPALGAAGLMRLFRDGIIQAVACRQSLARAGVDMGMSVNVPAAAVHDARYALTVEAVLQASGCPIGALRFEALDSTVGTGSWALLAETGVQSISSLDTRSLQEDGLIDRRLLARLSQSPFDRIKIDQAIISQVRKDPLGTLRLMRMLIRVGHDLGQEVVVEGLESTGMIEAAAVLGADFGQGFALAQPMPAEALAGWLADFGMDGVPAFVRTALGALACMLRWDERFAELSDEPYSLERHVQVHAMDGGYLRCGKGISAALHASHDSTIRAAEGGPFDPDYCRQRDVFFSLLVEHALVEEQRREHDSLVAA